MVREISPFILILILCFVVLLGPWTEVQAAIDPASPKPKVATLDLKKTKFEQTLKYPVKVEPKINATVLAEADGVITQTPQIGERVVKKQKILKIQQMDPVYSYSPFVTTAPVDGLVSEMLVTVGSHVSRGQKLLTIIDPKQVRLVAEVTAADLTMFKQGLEGVLKTNSSPSTDVVVKVVGVSPLISAATGTSTCLLEVKSPSAQGLLVMTPGSVSQVEFKIPSAEAIYVPKSAVLYKGSSPYVRVLDKQKAKHVTVKLGEEKEDVIEISDGLKPAQKIILRSSAFIPDGQEVQLEN